MAQLDFRNPEGLDTFNFFKRICIIERNTNDSSRNYPELKNTPNSSIKKPARSTYRVKAEKKESSDSESESSAHVISKSSSKLRRPPSSLKFPCPLSNHEHEVSPCRMCYSCLKPQVICNSNKCIYYENVPKVLKCAPCALCAESKGLALFSIFFCRQKIHGDSSAPLNMLRIALKEYIGKLGTSIIDSRIQFSVNLGKK